MKKILISKVVIAMLGTMILLSGCASTKISDILANPDKYVGTEVRVSGTVIDRYWVDILGLKAGAYQIDDGSGKIWVITNQEPPAEDKKASAKGTVSTSGKIGDRNFGIVIKEASEE